MKNGILIGFGFIGTIFGGMCIEGAIINGSKVSVAILITVVALASLGIGVIGYEKEDSKNHIDDDINRPYFLH